MSAPRRWFVTYWSALTGEQTLYCDSAADARKEAAVFRALGYSSVRVGYTTTVTP